MTTANNARMRMIAQIVVLREVKDAVDCVSADKHELATRKPWGMYLAEITVLEDDNRVLLVRVPIDEFREDTLWWLRRFGYIAEICLDDHEVIVLPVLG